MNKTMELTAMENKVNDIRMNLFNAVKKLETELNKNGENAQGKAKQAVDKAFADAKKAVKVYNGELAKKYYLSNDLMDIVKAGKVVPAVELKTSYNEDENRFIVSLENVTVYPTCKGMDGCKVLPENTIAKIDLLRREVAYLESGKNTMFLTGDVENKKDIPSDTVKTMIESEGEISKNKVKVTLAVVLHDITGGEYKKNVFTNLYNDFCKYMMKRTGEWGERTIVGKSTACDIVLEYAYMYFNNMREVKYTLG